MTRSCPSCGKTFPDENFFCGHDGTVTVQDQDPSDFDPRLGKQLGGYIVVARVADGAMGRVFEGRHPDTKARVAIKVLHADVARDKVAVERFKREFESARELEGNKYIVNALEFGETQDNSYFLTMEYLEGEELSGALKAGQPLSAARVVRVACQTALALEYAHSFGFIHRDLKPDNIFLCRTEQGDEVRLLDFGSVKLQMETGAKLTAFGTTVGSPYYMSPEQAMGKSDVDARSDVFALGAILYETLTGKIAFEAENVAMILMRILKETPAPPSGLTAGCPPRLDDVIDKALAKEKDHRYSGAKRMAQSVLAAYGLEGEVDDWAERPEAEVEAAISAATVPGPKAYGQPSLPGPEPQSGVSVTAKTELQIDAPTQAAVAPRESAARPSEVGATPAGVRSGTRTGVMALIGLGLLAAFGLAVMLMR